jgi:hypothetical protein
MANRYRGDTHVSTQLLLGSRIVGNPAIEICSHNAARCNTAIRKIETDSLCPSSRVQAITPKCFPHDGIAERHPVLWGRGSHRHGYATLRHSLDAGEVFQSSKIKESSSRNCSAVGIAASSQAKFRPVLGRRT